MSEAICICSHRAIRHYRQADGSETCSGGIGTSCTCAKFAGSSPIPMIGAVGHELTDQSGNPPCGHCGHLYREHSRKSGRCLYVGGCLSECDGYQTSPSVPDMVTARQLVAGGIKTVLVVMPMSQLSEMDEVMVARLIGRDLYLAADAVYIQRAEGLYLVLKNWEDPTMVGEAVMSAELQRDALLELRRRLK